MKQAPRNKKTEKEESEKDSAARRALQQAVSRIPTKPTEKLPMEYLRALPMVIGAGALLILITLITYVPALNSGFSKGISHFAEKTSELVDYTSQSASIGVSGFAERIRGAIANPPAYNKEQTLSYEGRLRFKKTKETINETRNVFYTAGQSVLNAASVLFGFDKLK